MKKSLLFLAGFSVVAMTANADRLQEGYITWPGSENLIDYVQQWNGGAGSISVNGQTWEDENFFISRVKPKVRFYNNASQVDPSRTQYNAEDGSGTDKRYIWWVPIGDCPPDGSYHTNALPNGVYDGEAFSMWSYVDHYGNWTSPWGWAPGAFADAAHKNGVAVSGVASVPFGGISANWKAAFEKIGNVTGEQVGKFLYYHGVDGLGYNSEWSSYAPTDKITPMHDQIYSYMENRNPIYENVWYAGTTDSGGCSFDQGVNTHSASLFKSASMFLNYNWNNPYTITSSVDYAKNVKRNPFYIYAGMNQQGGEPKSGENYPMLAQYQYSIGVWGAHNYNMFWQGRTADGAALTTVQRCYLNMCERWFTNGKRNPAIRMNLTTNRGHQALESFAGMSSMMTARSAMGWDLSTESFITYFNLGNGQFFNINGDRVSDKGWYNIGMQDYLPTWRWWFAPEFLQGNVTEGSTHMAADFTWDDAYFGGSCLQITGSTAKEYLHLFKTEFKLKGRMKFRIRYKLVEGEGDVRVVLSAKGAESTPLTSVNGKELSLCTVDNSAELREKSLERGNEGWQTIEVAVGPNDIKPGAPLYNELAVVAIEIQNAKNLKLGLGEFSIINTSTSVPAAPEVTLSKVLYQDMNGVDGKLIWNMANSKQTGEPVYNSDVKTSYFKVYAQEEDGEPQFMNATTSWASIVFAAPSTDQAKKIRFGVSAVGMRHDAESAITWSDWMDKGTYVQKDEVVLDKTTIKPNETFTISYVDNSHTASKFTVYNTAGQKVAEGEGVSYEVTGGLAQIGGYDLVVDEGSDNERRLNFFIQISGEAVGAMPEIYSISHNNVDVNGEGNAVTIEMADEQTLAYTGRSADGNASRAIRLNNGHIGGSNRQFGLQSGQSFTVAGWFKFDTFPNDTWALMNITNKAGAWPNCNWGWCWSYVEPGGVIHLRFRGSQSGGTPGELQYTYPNTRLQANVWTHIAITCEYSSEGFRSLLYINGVRQDASWNSYVSGNAGNVRVSGKNDEWCSGHNYPIASTDDLIFGGVEYQHTAIDGIIDDFQIWNKALDDNSIKESMNEVNRNNIPSGLMAYWDFEDDADPETMMFKSVGENKTIDGYNFDLVKYGDGEGAMTKVPKSPLYTSGCPFLVGTAYPVVTKAEWEDTDVRTKFTKLESRAAATEGESGQATVKFNRPGDHIVTLKLANSYGDDVREFPVFRVEESAAIGDVAVDSADFSAYTVDDVLFVEFAQDGAYNVEVYNAAGMLAGKAQLNAVAGQNAQITLGSAGVYLVRVSLDGKVLRTIKVMRR